MDSKEFKTLFDKVAKDNEFKKAFSGWYKGSHESIVILELQKSSFADSYYLNIKIFIQGAFERTYTPNKDLIKSSMGHITEQVRDIDILVFTKPMDDAIRKEQLEVFFKENIVPFTNKTLTKSGLRELSEKGEVFLLPAVKKELGI